MVSKAFRVGRIWIRDLLNYILRRAIVWHRSYTSHRFMPDNLAARCMFPGSLTPQICEFDRFRVPGFPTPTLASEILDGLFRTLASRRALRHGAARTRPSPRLWLGRFLHLESARPLLVKGRHSLARRFQRLNPVVSSGLPAS